MWMWNGGSTTPGGSVVTTLGLLSMVFNPPLTVLLTIFHSSTLLSRTTSPTLPSNCFPSPLWIVRGLLPVGVDSNTTVLVPLTSSSVMSVRKGGNAASTVAGGMNSAWLPVAAGPVMLTCRNGPGCDTLQIGLG